MERASSAAEVQKKKKGRNDNNDNTGAKWHEKRVEENYGFSICPFLYRTILIRNGVAAASAIRS